MSKQVLMIHEIKEDYFKLPLANYVLTFDDGLYSQFYYLKEFERIKTEKIFFISTGIICKEIQSAKFITCQEAHRKFFEEGRTEDYLTLDQLLELKHTSGFEIGGHGHRHLDFREINDNIVNVLLKLKRDTEDMQNFFSKDLKIRPTKFCFPYNKEVFGYRRMLKNNGFTDFYGSERIDINSLLEQK